jgi:hypothetical protein
VTRTRFAWLALLLCGCPEPPPPDVEPLFPESYASDWTMVRDCRRSIDHDLAWVQIWTDPTARATYEAREGTLPVGSTLLKEEFADEDCTDLVGFTVMRREEGFAPTKGDWHWQEVTLDGEVVLDGSKFECFHCHTNCGGTAEVFDWTCSLP